MIVWFMGMSGTGKSLLSHELVSLLRSKNIKTSVIELDGDVMRSLYGSDLDHSLVDREKSAMRMALIADFFSKQGSVVVCSTVCYFESTRNHLLSAGCDVCEILVERQLKKIKEIDSKLIYTKCEAGLLRNVAGIDIDLIVSKAPEIEIYNNSSLENLKLEVIKIYNHLLGGNRLFL